MQQGVIFDIKEFSVHDGPGVRQTVFLKGCPLRCNWCHNPEGWSAQPELLVRRSECIRCGACERICRFDPCTACGDCVPICPVRARWICGEKISSAELARRLRVNGGVYAGMGGGVTFSGGEPLMQPEFLFETVGRLGDMQTSLETCGYAEAGVFSEAMHAFDLILMDIKLVDSALHKAYTGVDNDRILENAARLCGGGTPFIIRIPLIPGVTDTEANLRAAARLLAGAKALRYVELLPYNRMAGAKYDWLGLTYRPQFDEAQPVALRHEIFQAFGIESRGR